MARYQIQRRSEIKNNWDYICRTDCLPRTPKKQKNKKLSSTQWKELFKNDPRCFKLDVNFMVEDSCRKRGLIKKFNGFETYKGGTETFINEQIDDIMNCYQKELDENKEPFFTGPKELEEYVEIACNKRINSFYREHYHQGIYKNLSKEEYIFSLQCDSDSIGETPKFRVDVARPVDNSWFGKPISGFNRMPDSIMKEKEFKMVFDKEHNNLINQGKDGPLYFKTIEFYINGNAEGLKKKGEITALAKYLGVERKRAREIKCRALKRLFHGISKVFPLEEYINGMKQKFQLKKGFKRISDKKLCELWDTRYNRFLNPYLDEMEPGPV